MKKIDKITNIALILILIKVFLCAGFVCAADTLRVPMGIWKRAGAVGENSAQNLFLQEKVPVIAKDGEKYFVEEVSPYDYAEYVDKLNKVLEEEAESGTAVLGTAKDNRDRSILVFLGISQDLRENRKSNNILAFFVLTDSKGKIIGARILYKPEMVMEAGLKAVTGADVIRFEYQDRGLSVKLREIVFGCLVRHGNYTLAAEVTKGNEVSRNSLLRALQKLGLSVKKTVPSWRHPTVFYIIELSQSARHAI